MDRLKTLFEDYIAYAGKLREETASMKSVLGLRDREIYDAGHKAFDTAVEEWVQAFARKQPPQRELVEALEYILFTALDYEEKAPFWYLTAVQRHTKLLIPLLADNSRKALLAEFEIRYPAGRRLPMQKELYRLLNKEDKKKKRFFLFH